MPNDFIGLFTLLVQARVRFVVAGGLAVVLHGFDRLTADVDIALDLSPENARAAIDALVAAGYRPLAPVNAQDFADARVRDSWHRDRGMMVFSLWDSTNTRPNVDMFVESPIEFESLYRDTILVSIGGISVRIASIQHLIEMKRQAGRPQDIEDIKRLSTKLPHERP